MASIYDVDIRSRGVTALVDERIRAHHEVSTIWSIENLISEVLATGKEVLLILEQLRLAEVPSKVPFSYVVDVIERIIQTDRNLHELAVRTQAMGYVVDRADELPGLIGSLQEIVSDDRWASDAAFAGGALDDWD